MACQHKRLMTVGFDWFCADCGEQLDPAVLFGKQEAAKYPPAEERTENNAPKRTRAKKTAQKAE